MASDPRTNRPLNRATGPGPGVRSSVRSLSPETAVTLSAVGDAVIIFLGLLAGYWLRFQSDLPWGSFPGSGIVELSSMRQRVLSNYLGLISLGAAFLVGTFVYLRLYEARRLLHLRESTLVIVQGATFWLFAYLGVSLFLKFDPPISRIYVALSYICTLAGLLVWRLILARLLRREWFAGRLRQNVVMVGWNREAADLFNAIHRDQRQPYRVTGFIPTPGHDALLPPPDAYRLGDFEEMTDVLDRRTADIVVLCDLELPRDAIISLANECERKGIHFKLVPSYFQILISGLQLETVSGVPILGVSRLPLDRLTNRTLKRLVDVFGALVGLVLAVPVLLVFGYLIRRESPGPIFFRQERVGRRGRPFDMLKLRSMRLDADKADHLSQSTLRDDPRMLSIGSFMRSWNLDEVPQFWNVLKGEMSLVGPRPERTYHSEKLGHEIPHYNARLAAKPGITGWAQVNGLRGNTDLSERVRYDLWYLENWSLWLDFQIMVMTFIRRENAY